MKFFRWFVFVLIWILYWGERRLWDYNLIVCSLRLDNRGPGTIYLR